MSRVGYAVIKIPEGVEAKVQGKKVEVKGKKGELSQRFDDSVKVEIKDGEINLERTSEKKEVVSKHGMYRSIINNMVLGVSEGFTKKLEFHGVGYRAVAKGQQLEMNIGFSHPVIFEFPDEISLTAESVKGKPPLVTLESADYQLVGQAAAKLRSLRKPEPYKGKGIRLQGEYVRKKAGKAAAK